MRLHAEGAISLHEAVLFADYWFDPEDTVRRKVMEEAGLKVSNIRYYKSQPWGFASNLMIGVICDLDGSEEIAMHDTNEVAEAVWIPRDEIQVYDNGVSLTFEMISRFKNGEL